jgi:hypothetical protein
VGWVWTAVAVWVLLALPAAVLLGRTIHRADQQELGARGADAGPPPAGTPALPVQDVTAPGTHPEG